jgi:uncharacterized membrane protein
MSDRKKVTMRLAQLRRSNNEKGAVLIFTAVFLSTVMMGAGALALDFGDVVATRSSAQSVADSAAVDAAQFLYSPIPNGYTQQTYIQYQANQSATRNGFSLSSPNTLTATIGCATGATTFVAVGSTGCATASAVQAIAGTTSGKIFATGTSEQRSAVASAATVAGFSIGTSLVTVSTQQSAVLNGLLGSLGSSVNLSALSYQGLASTGVTLNQLIVASGGVLTPSNVLSATITGKQLAQFMGTALSTQASTLTSNGQSVPTALTQAINAFTTLTPGISAPTTLTLCKVLTVNGSGCTVSQSALATDVNVLQTLSTEAEIANGTNALDLGTGLSLPNVTDAKLTTTLIQPPQYAFGPVGTTATTAQLTTTLTLKLSVGILPVVTISLPIAGAEGTATLQAITCGNDQATSVQIGVVTNAITEGSSSPNEPLVTVLGVLPIGLPLAIGGVSGASLTFTPPPAFGPTDTQTVGSTSPTISIGVTELSGLGVLLSGLISPITTVISDLTGGLLTQVLQALGVSAGNATVAATGALCDAPVLVG